MTPDDLTPKPIATPCPRCGGRLTRTIGVSWRDPDMAEITDPRRVGVIEYLVMRVECLACGRGTVVHRAVYVGPVMMLSADHPPLSELIPPLEAEALRRLAIGDLR